MIPVRIADRIVAAAGRRGVDRDALCRAVGLEPHDVGNADECAALWDEAVRRAGDPALPFAVAREQDGPYDLLRFLCMTCATLREAIERASRHLTATNLAVDDHGDRITIELEPGGRAAGEFALAELVAVGRELTGVDWAPIVVRFAHPAPAEAELSAYRAMFRAPITFDAARPGIDLATAVADLPLVRADPVMQQVFAHLITRQRPARSITELVRASLERKLHRAAPTLEQIARDLAMSPRALRRRLRGEGVSFRQILDDTRFALARRHLAEGDMSCARLASELGFSGARAFHRAFRRWTNTTPQQFALRAQRPN